MSRGYHPEPRNGLLPLFLVATMVGNTLEVTVPKPEPVVSCLMKHKPMGRDENGVTIMKHWRPCDERANQNRTPHPR